MLFSLSPSPPFSLSPLCTEFSTITLSEEKFVSRARLASWTVLCLVHSFVGQRNVINPSYAVAKKVGELACAYRLSAAALVSLLRSYLSSCYLGYRVVASPYSRQ